MLDVAITGGMVVDGTGAEPRRADVGIVNGKVAVIGELKDSSKQVIDNHIIATIYHGYVCWQNNSICGTCLSAYCISSITCNWCLG